MWGAPLTAPPPTASTGAVLGVTRSRSRPKVTNDNPYGESWFKTLKYAPMSPDRFESIHHARDFMDEFVGWCNHQHRHTGIGLHTPADLYGLADEKKTRLAARRVGPPPPPGSPK